MFESSNIADVIYAAKDDLDIADDLIRSYLPFIKAKTSDIIKKSVDDNTEELSIAMLGFHEAIRTYDKFKGNFLKYAQTVMKSRIIDHNRKELRHQGHISLDIPLKKDDDLLLSDTISDDKDHSEEILMRSATKEEIIELNEEMKNYYISLKDVADNCPKQERTFKTLKNVIEQIKDDIDILDELLNTRRLPIAKILAKVKVERKLLERHRKYLIAMLIIYTNGYEMIRGHLRHIKKEASK